MAVPTFELTPQEQRLRDLLLDVARYVTETKENFEEKFEGEVKLRWAGGWVRDKFLNIPSHDIDTAINCMTGYKFCLRMQKYFEDPKNHEKHALGDGDLGNIHKIIANPEKSKNLETATIRILGFDVDFVNLRTEVYSETSRNPAMEFGTAEEDASRRDATINALFYDLHTGRIEDFCGGIPDLVEGRIRTPLDPLTTFTDDPLRVLRLIRFASRLDFKIDTETEMAMTDPTVANALKLKISRERVGTEVGKMLTGNNPKSALHLIDRVGLYPTVFTDPTIAGIALPDTSNWSSVYECLEELKSNETPGSIYNSLVRSEDAKLIAWIIAAVTPWSSISQPAITNGKPTMPLGTLVAREGIKATSKICDVITGAFRNYKEITSLRDAIKRKDSYTLEPDTLGMSIRKWDILGKNWRLQVLLAILVEVLNKKAQTSNDGILSGWQLFIDHLTELDVMDAPSIKPLVNGNMLRQALGEIKAGVWMKPALEVCIAWQLRNPGSNNSDAAIAEVVDRRQELMIPNP